MDADREKALSVGCPTCNAQPNRVCKGSNGESDYWRLHVTRWNRAGYANPQARTPMEIGRSKRATYWEKFDTCPSCQALPGNACREATGWEHTKRRIHRAHLGRPLNAVKNNDHD